MVSRNAFGRLYNKMPLLKRQPKKTIKVSAVAEQTGLSAKTIKRMADRLGWKQIRYSDSITAPIFLFETVVNEWIAERQGR